jgi:hypothetical protein
MHKKNKKKGRDVVEMFCNGKRYILAIFRFQIEFVFVNKIFIFLLLLFFDFLLNIFFL